MDNPSFWKLIDASRRKAGGDPGEQLEVLQSQLEKLSAAEIVDFDRIFTEYWVRAYTWDLWAAAYIIGGGCSDDGFADFRGGLISRGEKVYERSLANPESLTIDDDCQVEGFHYVASRAWEEKTGRPFDEYPQPNVSLPSDPSGAPWEEDDLPRRFPKLWKTFGEE